MSATPTMLDLAIIRTSGGTQTRSGTYQATVDEYAEAMRAGAEFPPVEVFLDGENYWLADGFHRVAAAREAGYEAIAANVHLGTRRDAVLYSVGANATHGLRRSNADKRRAVEMLLKDEEWRQWSDREIARRVGVSATFVGSVRATVSDGQSSTVRKGADGRAIDTANIGAKTTTGSVNRLPPDDQVLKDTAAHSWLGRYKRVAWTLPKETLVFVATSEYMIALRESAKVAAAALGLFTTNTEHGEALFSPRVAMHAGLAMAVKMLAHKHDVVWYEDNDPALRDFVRHHTIVRPAREAAKASEPATLTIPKPAQPTNGYIPPIPQGTKVRLPSGHVGTVTGDHGGGHVVETVNGKRTMHRRHLTVIADDEPAAQARLVSFYDVHEHWDKEAQAWDDPQYVYIGRRSNRHSLPDSPWRNPVPMMRHADPDAERQRVIDEYRAYITPRIQSGELNLEELRGKTLVCWCSPLPCHGDVLLELLGNQPATGLEWGDGRPVTPEEMKALEEANEVPALERETITTNALPWKPLQMPTTWSWLNTRPDLANALERVGSFADGMDLEGMMADLGLVEAWLDERRALIEKAIDADMARPDWDEPPTGLATVEDDYVSPFASVSGRRRRPSDS